MKRSFNNSADRQDIYTRVTDRIISDLEKGVRSWTKPWDAEHLAEKITRPLRHNGLPYAGVNILMLWAASMDHGFNSSIWMTYKQAEELKAHVRRGEKGSLVVYASKLTKTEQDDNGNDVERNIPFLKGYTVFNVEQIEDLPDHYYAKPTPEFNPVERIENAENFFATTGADVRYGGNRAYYSQDGDYIKLPPIEAFRDAESFYATLAHESTHWTKHPERLERDFGRKKWGDEGYAREELVAEIGSAFLCADLEITPEVREDHAAYIESWLQVLKNDKRAIFQAAAHAQRAVDYLHKLNGTEPNPTPSFEPQNG